METTTRTSGSGVGCAEQKKCAHGGNRTRTRQNRYPQFDQTIIARYPLPVRGAIYLLAALTVSGVLPMALVALQTYLEERYGMAAFALCMAFYAAVVALVVRHEHR